MDTLEVVAFIVVFFVCFTVLLDFLAGAFASVRGKHHKSAVGNFIEIMANEERLWWVLLIVAALFAYGIKVCMVDL